MNMKRLRIIPVVAVLAVLGCAPQTPPEAAGFPTPGQSDPNTVKRAFGPPPTTNADEGETP
jgi:hypothetical protein